MNHATTAPPETAPARRRTSSEYLEWVKTQPRTRYSLATSGVADYPLAKLIAATGGALRLEDLELSGPSFYGYPPLQQALAAKAGVPAESIVAATGTSMANHLVMAATLEPGDEVLVERPAYDPLLGVARYLGAEVKRFERRFEPGRPQSGFALDPEAVARALTPRTRLIVLTSPHNPSGVVAGEDALREVGALAERAGAYVLVDEVYREMDFAGMTRSAFGLGGRFIVTSSLTKAYGLSGLRCGWIVAPPDLARSMWRLNDLYGVIPAHTAERLSVVALQHLEVIRARARALLEANRALLGGFLDSRRDLEVARPPFGTLVFPRLPGGNVDELCNRLRERYETWLVPGRFFERPEHFRLAAGCETASLGPALDRLGMALDELAGKH